MNFSLHKHQETPLFLRCAAGLFLMLHSFVPTALLVPRIILALPDCYAPATIAALPSLTLSWPLGCRVPICAAGPSRLLNSSEALFGSFTPSTFGLCDTAGLLHAFAVLFYSDFRSWSYMRYRPSTQSVTIFLPEILGSCGFNCANALPPFYTICGPISTLKFSAPPVLIALMRYRPFTQSVTLFLP